MSHFYGILQGNRGEATRCGHKSSGLHTVAAAWSGAVQVDLLVNADGEDIAHVYLRTWHGNGVNQTLYMGPVGEFDNRFA
jgi:hypothetical protein